MRHYEIVLLVHPDQSEQVPAMLAKYQDMLTAENGAVHRSEDWGRRKLAFTINEVHKAHYIMLNVECTLETLRELEKNFKFNDSILRSLVIRRKAALTEQSALARAKVEADQEEEREKAREVEREAERVEAEKRAAIFAKKNPVVVADAGAVAGDVAGDGDDDGAQAPAPESDGDDAGAKDGDGDSNSDNAGDDDGNETPTPDPDPETKTEPEAT